MIICVVTIKVVLIRWKTATNVHISESPVRVIIKPGTVINNTAVWNIPVILNILNILNIQTIRGSVGSYADQKSAFLAQDLMAGRTCPTDVL